MVEKEKEDFWKIEEVEEIKELYAFDQAFGIIDEGERIKRFKNYGRNNYNFDVDGKAVDFAHITALCDLEDGKTPPGYHTALSFSQLEKAVKFFKILRKAGDFEGEELEELDREPELLFFEDEDHPVVIRYRYNGKEKCLIMGPKVISDKE